MPTVCSTVTRAAAEQDVRVVALVVVDVVVAVVAGFLYVKFVKVVVVVLIKSFLLPDLGLGCKLELSIPM